MEDEAQRYGVVNWGRQGRTGGVSCVRISPNRVGFGGCTAVGHSPSGETRSGLRLKLFRPDRGRGTPGRAQSGKNPPPYSYDAPDNVIPALLSCRPKTKGQEEGPVVPWAAPLFLDVFLLFHVEGVCLSLALACSPPLLRGRKRGMSKCRFFGISSGSTSHPKRRRSHIFSFLPCPLDFACWCAFLGRPSQRRGSLAGFHMYGK